MSLMQQYATQWQAAQAKNPSEWDTPDDGTYTVVVDDVTYSEADRNGAPTKPTFIYALRVVNGDKYGMRFRKFHTINNEQSLSYLKGDMIRLGVNPPANPDEIIIALRNIVGMCLEVTVKSRSYQGKVYKDCVIDKMLKRGTPVSTPQTDGFSDGVDPSLYDQVPF